LLLGSVAVAGPLSGSAATNPKRERLWIEVGKDDFLLKRNEEFLAPLKDEGVHHERHLTEGKLIPSRGDLWSNRWRVDPRRPARLAGQAAHNVKPSSAGIHQESV